MNKAISDLKGILERHDRNPDKKPRQIIRSATKDMNASDAEKYLETIRSAEKANGVRIKMERLAGRLYPKSYGLNDAESLRTFLGVSSPTDLAMSALSEIPNNGRRWFPDFITELRGKWERCGNWNKFSPKDVASIRNLIRAAEAIEDDLILSQDMRTFSRRILGDSKFIETHLDGLAELLRIAHPQHRDASRDELLLKAGLLRLDQPFHVSGPISIDDEPLPNALPYVGIPQQCAPLIRLSRLPRCILTVENFVAFHRHCSEINHDHEDLVIFTSGQPSSAMQSFLSSLAKLIRPETPRYHWGDIDCGGVRIFNTVDKCLQGVAPHLMSVEIAEQYGSVPADKNKQEIKYSSKGIARLAEYLNGTDAKHLEQEQLDPERP